MAGALTAAVIDTLCGQPASGMLIDLFRLQHGKGQRYHLRTVESAASGSALIEGDALLPATYELLFHVGRYFRGQRVVLDQAAFIDVIPVRFTITDATRSHHLTLLASPWSYTVYRI